jgi:hypothetical protein
VLYTFGRVPKWANGGRHQSLPPADLQIWDDFVRAIVRHAKGRISAWELWNEPNDPHFWNDNLETIVEMAQRACRIIKSEQPDAIVLTPSPTWSRGSPSQWFEQYFAAGGGKFADIIAFHGYVGPQPEGLTGELERIRAAAQDHGVNKPIWDTESSWGIDAHLPDAANRAAFLARSYILHVSQGVHRFYWYAWDGSDGGQTPPNQSWGTLWSSREPDTSQARAYRTVRKWLDQVHLPLICNAADSVWRCKLNRDSLIVWNTAGQRNFQLDPQYTHFQDLSGNFHDVPDTHSIPIGPAPILARTN